jgi:hypothetical protein
MGKTNHHSNQTAQKEMIYEPGTMECRSLIDAKDGLLEVQKHLSNLEGTSEILNQLKEMYKDLDYMHECLK